MSESEAMAKKPSKTWVTEIKAVDPTDDQLKTFGGPSVVADTLQEAEQYCQENGLGYCKVIGELA